MRFPKTPLMLSTLLCFAAVEATAQQGVYTRIQKVRGADGKDHVAYVNIDARHSQAAVEYLPQSIKCGPFNTGHVQGIAVDVKNRAIYCSFTSLLAKYDFDGKLIGTVSGLLGHLGCLDFNEADGKIYGSLEYKDDNIGRGILEREGSKRRFSNNFYVAIIDGAKITRTGMDGGRDGVMKVVSLPTVVADYSDTVEVAPGRRLPHRFACSGIDGISFGPKIGETAGRGLLTVAYGVYGDTNRPDNNYQVLLQYDIADWDKKYAAPLSLDNPVFAGPKKPAGQYFVHTGSTDWGIQNLEYDAATQTWYMAVYKGKKPEFPNYMMYAFKASSKPVKQALEGIAYYKGKAKVITRQMLLGGLHDSATGISGWNFPFGSTGLHALGAGYFYISENGHESGGDNTIVRLYRRTTEKEGFVRVE